MPLRESPQAVKQHAVPQNIMQVEFKIIGELTMRQFMYLLFFTILAFTAFKSGLPPLISWPLTGLLAFAGIAFAFIPIEERGLDQWIINFVGAISTPTQRVWRKIVEPPSYFTYHAMASIKSDMITVAPTASRRKLEQFLEHGGTEKRKDPLDIFDNEDEYIQKVRNVFGTSAGVTIPVETTMPVSTYQPFTPTPQTIPSIKTYMRTEDEIIAEKVLEEKAKKLREEKEQSINAAPTSEVKTVPTQPQAVTPPPENLPQTPQQDQKPAALVQPNVIPIPNKVVASESPLPIKQQEITPEKVFSDTQKLVTDVISESKPKVPAVPVVTPKPIEIKSEVKQDINAPKPLPIPEQLPPEPAFVPTVEQVTPDRLTGRRFTHLTKTEGEIILPIRGERVLKTVEEVEEEDINEKANELLALVAKVKKEQEKLRTVKTGEALSKEDLAAQKPLSEVAKTAVEEATIKNVELGKQIEALKAMTAFKTTAEKEAISFEIKRLQEEKFQDDEQIRILKQQIVDLEEKLARQGTEAPKVIVQKVIEKIHVPVFETEFEEKKPQIAPQKPIYAKSPPITNVPNTINGVIKDDNLKLLEAAVVMIKDARGDTVRALKTNKLGQFAITTPVSNGAYTVEVTKPGTKLIFTPVSVEAHSEVLPPIEITGKLSA